MTALRSQLLGMLELDDYLDDHAIPDPPRTEGTYRPPWWAWIPRTACRAGLHFMAWDDQCDGYRCACRRQFLWAEQISNIDEWRAR
jgi:hypothetical protein